MGKVIHSCGHEDKWRPVSGWPVTFLGYNYDIESRPVEPTVDYMTVCHDCYVWYVTHCPDEIAFDKWEVGDHLRD